MVAKLQKDQLVESYGRLGTLEDVAEELQVSRMTVIKYMDRFEIQRKKNWPKKMFAGKEELESLYREYESSDKVAKHLGVSKKLVLKYMDKYGIDRNQKPKLKERIEELRTLAEQGMWTQQIAEHMGYHPDCIRKAAKENGISIHDPYHKGYIITHGGYRLIQAENHDNADSKGYIREHRYIMSQELGRPLDEDEVVHHVNEDKLDNRPENLEVMSRSDHSRHHRAKSIKI